MVTRPFEPDFPVETVNEGKVTVLVPKLSAFTTEPSEYASSKAPVFYNPVMEMNRDISILALQIHQLRKGKEITICEPLTSSGIRGVRFATEIRGISKVVINDISTRAVNVAKYNVALNNLGDRVKVTHKDANCLLSCFGKPRQRFNIVDLDPFGTPVPYLDSAIRATRNEGLLAVTATDLACLCGVHPRACTRKYGGKPLRTEYCHELAIRLVAGCIAMQAAKYETGINISFSHSTAHYVRVYAEIACGAKKADESLHKMGYVLHCFSCLHREIAQSLLARNIECPECGSRMDYAGPLWLGGVVDKQFCELMRKENTHRAFRNSAAIAKMLLLTSGEAEAPPTYYVLDKLSAKLAVPAPPMAKVLASLVESGYSSVPTHFNSRGIKTDASVNVIRNLVRDN